MRIHSMYIGHLLAASAFAFGIGCGGGGALPLETEVKDGALTVNGKADELEVVVKTLPGTEVRFGNESKNTGEQANVSFIVPKNTLKLGKNTFPVTASGGVLFSKKTASGQASWDAQANSVLRFHPGASGGTALACSGVMCGATTFSINEAGKLPLQIDSPLAGTVSIGSQTVNVGSGKRATIDLDFLRALKAMPVTSEKLSFPLTFEANGVKTATAVEFSGPAIGENAAKFLAKVEKEKGAALFPEETANDATHDLLVVVGVPANKFIVVGKSAASASSKFGDVDLVGIATVAERTFRCTGSEIEYKDLDIAVYERRTGKSLGTKKLRADRVPCPPAPSATPLKGEVRIDDVKRVLGESLK